MPETLDKEKNVTPPHINELKNQAFLSLESALIQIRLLAVKSFNANPNEAQEALKKIYEISDSCHNIPKLLDHSDFSSIDVEIKATLKAIKESNKD